MCHEAAVRYATLWKEIWLAQLVEIAHWWQRLTCKEWNTAINQTTLTCWEICSSYFSWFLKPRSQVSQKWEHSGSFLFFCCRLHAKMIRIIKKNHHVSFCFFKMHCCLINTTRAVGQYSSYLSSMIVEGSETLFSTLMPITSKILTWTQEWSYIHDCNTNADSSTSIFTRGQYLRRPYGSLRHCNKCAVSRYI